MKENFNGFEIKWVFHTCVPPGQRPKSTSSWNSDDNEIEDKIVPEGNPYFELRFLKRHREDFFANYLPQVLKIAENIKNKEKVLKLWTLKYTGYSYDHKAKWESVKLNHPSTFNTLALDPILKQDIIDDLNRFLESKEFYKKVGRAWKRGYLLYGPPGTGKSSLIAAIANYLKFDVYDLQLMHIQGDAMLRKMLLSTTNRSILVIEDIDCSMGLPDKRKVCGISNDGDGNEDESDDDEKDSDNDKAGDKNGNTSKTKISLSGLLNFIDGLWSSCGDERIIIFTTNHKEKIEPALLRPGRMDFHIHMSYLCMEAFKKLASNYLDISEKDEQGHNRHFGEIEEMIRTINVTPAEVAEELMKGKDVERALEGVVGFLKRKRVEDENERIEKEKAKRIKKIKKEEKAKEKALNIMEALTSKTNT